MATVAFRISMDKLFSGLFWYINPYKLLKHFIPITKILDACQKKALKYSVITSAVAVLLSDTTSAISVAMITRLYDGVVSLSSNIVV
jgi:hypothetical protein